MNTAEALKIIHFVQEACPAQKFSEYTPDIWAELLADLNYADTRAAVFNLGQRLTFIGPPDIRTEVRRIRDERIKANFTEPAYEKDDVLGGLRAIRSARRALGDGEEPGDVLSLAGRERNVPKMMRDALNGIATPPDPAASRGTDEEGVA